MLIDKILSENPELVDDVASALLASPDVIRRYQAGRAVPMERQMLLAVYAIECVPAYTRLGHLLRGQLRAAIAFAARETETHHGPPPISARDEWR